MNPQLSLFEMETPSMPVFDASRCTSKPINYETASNFVNTYHYAQRTPTIMAAIGMYVDDVLAGVITYGMASAPLLNICGTNYIPQQIELNRLVVHEWAGRNSESWLIGQSFAWLPQILPTRNILISYADTAQQHIGCIYQATNWLYTGLSIPGGNPSEMYVNGERMSSKAAYDRFGSQGRLALEGMGLEVVKGKGTYKHRYVYFLGNKRQRRTLRQALKWPVLPYPKL